MCRVPNSAPIKAKMLYTENTDAMRTALFGFSAEIKATGWSDIAEKAVLEKFQRHKP